MPGIPGIDSTIREGACAIIQCVEGPTLEMDHDDLAIGLTEFPPG
jgi:hypothetical protein